MVDARRRTLAGYEGDASRVELLLTTRTELPWGELFGLGLFVETVVVEEDALVLLEFRLGRSPAPTRLEWSAIARVVSFHGETAPSSLSVHTRDGRIFEISFTCPSGKRPRFRLGSRRIDRKPSRVRFEPLINRTGLNFSADRNPRELAGALCTLIAYHGVEHETEQVDAYPRVKYWRD